MAIAVGLHVLEAERDGDRILLTHESHSRRPFAEGAVRGAEWLVKAKPGVYDFRDIFDKLELAFWVNGTRRVAGSGAAS